MTAIARVFFWGLPTVMLSPESALAWNADSRDAVRIDFESIDANNDG